jgi:hypothetical protein
MTIKSSTLVPDWSKIASFERYLLPKETSIHKIENEISNLHTSRDSFCSMHFGKH